MKSVFRQCKVNSLEGDRQVSKACRRQKLVVIASLPVDKVFLGLRVVKTKVTL